MKICIEGTSVLQAIFLISTLDKIIVSKKTLEVHVFFFNNHVNDGSIKQIKSLFQKSKYKPQFYDCRKQNKLSHFINKKIDYDYFIVRSRLDVKLHNSLHIMRDFFIKTGNNNNVKIALTNFCYKNLLSVDDGLSNWRDINFKFTLRFIPHFHFNKEKSRKLAYINKYFFEANNQKIVRHYSIFSKNENLNIMKNFRKNIKYLSKNFKKQNNIEYLFVGTWPAFKNRLSRNNRDIQLKVLINYLKKNKQQQSKIYIKHHPKFKLELIRDDKIKFKSLSKKLNDAPLEIIINSLSGIKEIYAFPSTSLYLINFLKLKKVKINIFIKKDSFAYAYQLKDIFDNKSFNLIYI